MTNQPPSHLTSDDPRETSHHVLLVELNRVPASNILRKNQLTKSQHFWNCVPSHHPLECHFDGTSSKAKPSPSSGKLGWLSQRTVPPMSDSSLSTSPVAMGKNKEPHAFVVDLYLSKKGCLRLPLATKDLLAQNMSSVSSGMRFLLCQPLK